MNFEYVLCPLCRGYGLARNRELPRPATHASQGHQPPINGGSGCGCTWVTCPRSHIIAELPVLMPNGTRSAIVSYLDPDSVNGQSWLIESREEEENE